MSAEFWSRQWWQQWFGGRRSPSYRRRCPTPHTRPWAEPLEDRTLPSGAKLDYVLGATSAPQFSASFGESLTTDGSGNVYVAGTFGGTVDFDPGPGTATLDGSQGAAFVGKYTPAGRSCGSARRAASAATTTLTSATPTATGSPWTRPATSTSPATSTAPRRSPPAAVPPR